ncbi:phenylalanine--tRNA ligase subunit beta [Candidatus Saccharibacteria bacterium]|nr:phenylalanine--tRNA ligase subunit beta [Candidatus Saccharibacteria bacterium]
MKISLNEIKKLVPKAAEIETDELVRLIGSRLVEVEGTEDWSEKYNNIYIVKVVACEAIPDTHLHLCQIDDGKDGVQVVCGAPNVHEGMFAVWIAPGAIVPQTFGTDEEFEIGARKMRGYESNGMLAGLDELDLGDDHSGIVEIDPEMPGVKSGASFAEVFDLNDIILDIENKSLTHRPDTFGLIGFAREVSGILGEKFREPEFSSLPLNEQGINVNISDPEICARYSCAVLDFTDAPRSEYLTKDDAFLAKAGMKSISPIVDVTNILMLVTGQPLHAFDYDKFIKVGGTDSPEIVVRTARDGEKLTLLDGEEIECDENDILIVSSDVPVALAGAMGGENTAIDGNTKRIILESATFSLYHLRKTQMKHGIFSEAITRFTKGQPAGMTMPTLAEAVKAIGSGPLAVVDCFPAKPAQPVISLSLSDINSLLGTSYTADTVADTLDNVGFNVECFSEGSKTWPLAPWDADSGPERPEEKTFHVKSPFWRTDIHIKEDIIEEVGRLLGYDNIPLDFAKRPFIGAKEDPLFTLKNRIRDILSDRLAANEVLTYSFVSQKLQETVGEDPEDSYKIVNSISPELQCFRQSIAPSLLEKVAMNLKAGFKNFSLYEINQTANKKDGLNSENVPEMKTKLAFVTLGDFYAAKASLVALLKNLGIPEPELSEPKEIPGYYEKKHSAVLEAGYVGEIKSAVSKRLKIDQVVAVFELDLEKLLQILPETGVKSLNFSRFPSVSRDVTVKVKSETDFGSIKESLGKTLAEKCDIYKIEPVSLYQKDKKTKNLSFTLTFASLDHTLNTGEISAIMEKVEKSVRKEFAAEIV